MWSRGAFLPGITTTIFVTKESSSATDVQRFDSTPVLSTIGIPESNWGVPLGPDDVRKDLDFRSKRASAR